MDRVQIPDPEFGDNQLARWLATDVATQHNNREDPEEDSWDEREEAQDLPMVSMHSMGLWRACTERGRIRRGEEGNTTCDLWYACHTRHVVCVHVHL